MKPPELDIEARTPIWDQMQMLYMDTDPGIVLHEIAAACARSPYSIDDLERILFNEVLTACRFNLFSLAGEWQGFELEWLVKRVLKKHRFDRRKPFVLRWYTESWWRPRLKPEIVRLREASVSSSEMTVPKK